MSAVLDFFRQREPRFQQVPDAELTNFIGEHYPQLLQDQEFAGQVANNSPSLQPQAPATQPAFVADAEQNNARLQRSGNRQAAAALQQQAAEQEQQIQAAYDAHPLVQVLKPVGRSGKVALAAEADLAHLMRGEAPQELSAYGKNPDAPLPVEELIPETRGLGRVSAVAGAAGARMLPVLGQGVALGAAGLPAYAAAALPMGVTEQGGFDPVGAAIAAGLPGVTRYGEQMVAAGLKQAGIERVVVDVLSRDPLMLKGKVVQRLGGMEISNDAFRKMLEAGGGMVAANTYLAAMQAPEILALPAEERKQAALDAVAGNLAASVMGFTSRQGPSLTLEGLYPEMLRQWRKANPQPNPLGGDSNGQETQRRQTLLNQPVPESPATTQAQASATLDPNTPKSTVLQTPGEAPPEQPGLTPVPTTQGTAWVNPAKADPEAVAERIDAGGGGTDLGMSTEAKPPGEAVLQTKNATGDVVQDEVVTPESLPGAIQAGQSVAPGGTQELKPAEQVITERTEAAPVKHPGNNLADYVAAKLRAGEAVEPLNVRTMGGTLGLDERQAGEWAELGATEVAREIAQQPGMTDREKFHALVNLYDRMPTNGSRTVETKVNQQYSTPPPLAWVGSVLADFAHGTAYGEPTAGHGMLMIGAPAGQVFANELDPNRNLRLQRFLNKAIAREDATGQNLFQWLQGAKIDRVGQNPPFGTVLNAEGTGNKEFPIINAATKAKTTTSIDLAIALNTFEAMTPQGKGFAIIGAKTGTPFGGTFGTEKQRAEEYRRPVMMEFFERFNVVDWFTLGGDLYRKMGAAWPVDMIIVHGKGRTPPSANGGTPRPWVKPPRVIETWEQLAALIPEGTHESIKSGSSTGQTGGSPGGTRPGAGGVGAVGPGRPPVSVERPERPPSVSRPGGGTPAAPSPVPNPTPSAPPRVPGDSSTGIGTGTPATPGPVAQGGAKGGQPGTPAVGGAGPVAAGSGKTEPVKPQLTPNSKLPPPKPSVPVEGLPASLMVKYQGVSKGPSLNLVAPRNIANQMLAAQQALEAEVGMSIDNYVADRLGRDVKTLHTQLSGAQIDAAALAIRNIERGSALITADETGVGKGRVVAAILEYARMRNLVPIFVTAKKNLYADMVGRDLPALGNKDYKPFITDSQFFYEDGHGREVKGKGSASAKVEEMQGVIRSGNLPGGAHAVFTTYDQLKADRPAGFSETPKQKFKRQQSKTERPDGPKWAMIRALAPRAIFILDEAHLAAGPTSELNMKFNSILPTAKGNYYSSATFAKRPDNLGLYALGTLMRRTGLNHEQMTEALTKGGVPLQQALTSMLAESGELVRRQQDWTGVEMGFKMTAKDAASDIEAADTYTSYIRDLMALAKQVNAVGAGLEDGENQVRADEETVRVEEVTFGSRLFNLSNQYLLALRSPAIVREAIAELKAGRKPFIALYNTMEGPLLDLRARKLPLSFAGILRREMAKMLKLTVRDPMAEGGKREVELTPEDLPDGGKFYRELERQIDATDFSRFPISPIDYIKSGLKQAGYSVGELTARDGEVDDSGGEITISKRDKQERNKILSAYNNGQTDVIIVNGSGSTGLSTHTDPRFKDQRQRVMIVGQPAPDINEFMQMLWRVMRSGQTSKPVYRILNTALAAERRFATMLRGKMTSLNANTTAEGESGMTQIEGFAEDIFNVVGDEVVFRVMQANQDLANLLELGTGNEDAEAFEHFARYATGRFVLLPNADAQRLWDEIIAEYRDEIQQLDEAGENPLRATAEDLRARTVEKQDIVAASGNTVFDGAATLEKAMVKPPKAPPSHAEALQRAKDNLPTIKQRVRDWLDKSRAAEAERLAAATARGNTPEQLDRIRQTFDNVRINVVEASRKVGDTFGVDMLGDGSSSFYGVAAEMKLADKSVSDFASASRQQLILTTNTFRGKLTLPLSKLNRGDQEMLQLLDEDAAAEQFDKTAESNAERYIITGNLLRGWEAADQATNGREVGRPRVTIYTREDGTLNTGILMPPAWTPGESAEAQQVITSADQFEMLVRYKTPMRSMPMSSVHPVEARDGMLIVPSSGQGKSLWGEPMFAQFFAQPPIQRAGNFVGTIKPGAAAQMFNWLQAKGVRLMIKPSETASMRGSGGGGAASRGAFVSGASTAPGKLPPTVTFGGMQFVRPLQLPELVRLTRELSGAVPSLRKFHSRKGAQTLGQFGDGMITLDPRIFKDPETAAKVLAHELGHLVDYLPHETLRRGNLLGHLLALKGWLKQTFGPLNNKDLRNELLAVTQWWRPYNPATDPKSYVAYRSSPEELYADALSVLFNAPAELETRAPKFYQAFWDNLGKRTEVQDALFAVQELLNKGMLPTAAEREANIARAFAEGEARWKQAVADREQAARSWDGWWTRLWQELYWNFYPLEQRAAQVEKKGATLSPERDPRQFLDDLGYRDVTVMAWGRHVFERVIQPMEAAGLTLEDAGKFLFYTRILNGDRSGLANPGGLTPDAARLGLLKMNLDLGLGKMTLLRDAIRVFHEDVYRLAEQAVEVGAYNRQTFDQVIKPNKGSYATFAVLDYLDDIPAGIKQQIGTLKDVANPFQATILKSIGLINLIAYQNAKNKTVDFLRTYYPDDITPTNTQHEPPPRRGFGTFMRLENGRPTWYYTDPYIADAFNKLNPRQLWWFTRAADGIFRKIIYPMIITYNPGFLFFLSPLRDIQRTGRNLPGMRFSVGTLPAQYAAELSETAARYQGQAGPLIREMEANLGLGTPFDQLARAHRDDFMAELLRKMRVLPDHALQGWLQSTLFKPVRKLLDTLEWGGMTLDAVAKTASYRRLRRAGWSPRAAAYWVRNNAGLPNINKKGLLVRQVRALVPFWNVFVQGWRADLKNMSNPTTRGGWWLRYIMSNGLMRALLALGATGALGAALKELFDGIGEYDKTNYASVPVGQVGGGDFQNKTVYLRVPEDETARLLGGIISKTIRTMGPDDVRLSGIFDFGMGQFPSFNPALSVPAKWIEFATGHQPTDPFRGAPIVPDRNWKAGGWDSLQPMGAWTFGQTGIPNFVRWDPNSSTTWELAASAIPGINRVFKVSDQGYRERQRSELNETQAATAREKLHLAPEVQSLEMEYWRLSRLTKERRTEVQQTRFDDLHYWYQRTYRPYWEAIEAAVEDKNVGQASALRRDLAKDSLPYYRPRK